MNKENTRPDIIEKPEEKYPDASISDEHIEAAKKILSNHLWPRYRKRVDCTLCKNERNSGINIDGLLQACLRCVDLKKAYLKWLKYCEDFSELSHFLKK